MKRTVIVFAVTWAALLLMGLPLAGLNAQSADEDSAAPPARAEGDQREREAEADPPPGASSGDQFTPTERLRHDQEVDFPVDI